MLFAPYVSLFSLDSVRLLSPCGSVFVVFYEVPFDLRYKKRTALAECPCFSIKKALISECLSVYFSPANLSVKLAQMVKSTSISRCLSKSFI